MITIWGRRNSLNVQKVMWTVGELDLAFNRKDVGGSFGTTEEYRGMNPNNVVPTIVDGDLTLYESNTCVRYLARTYGAGSLYPEDPKAAALADQWMEWQTSTFSGAFFQLFFNKVRSVDSPKAQAAATRGLDMTISLLEQLEIQLAGKSFIIGDTLTMADIPLGSHLYRWFEMEIDRPELPNVASYYKRLTQRTTYQHHVMVPFGSNPDEWLESERLTMGRQ